MEHDVSDVTPVDRPPEQSGDSSTQAWSTPGVLNRHLRKEIYEDRRKDIGISTSREIPGRYMADKRRWIYNFLDHYKCFEGYDQCSDLVKAMRISGNKFNDQVVLVCQREDQIEEFTTRLGRIPAPKGNYAGLTQMVCHGWKEDTISVYISWVRSTIDIQKYLIDGFLLMYGKVKDHWPVTDERGVETFEHRFIMSLHDVRSNPPPGYFWLGKQKLRVKYRGQQITCYACDEVGHVAGVCPKKAAKAAEKSNGNGAHDESALERGMYNHHFPPPEASATQAVDLSAPPVSVPATSSEPSTSTVLSSDVSTVSCPSGSSASLTVESQSKSVGVISTSASTR